MWISKLLQNYNNSNNREESKVKLKYMIISNLVRVWGMVFSYRADGTVSWHIHSGEQFSNQYLEELKMSKLYKPGVPH